MRRRDFLAASAGTLLAAPLAGCDDHGASRMPKPLEAAVGPDGRRRLPWQNWSGYQHCLPAERLTPKNEDELATLLREAPGPLRPVGAGHSFMPLVPTDGSIISLRHFEGLIEHDSESLTATVGAGTKLGALSELLEGIGQAMPNMPDIDEQTIAGATATATHGSGETLGALHSRIVGLRIVTPRGDVLDCNREHNADMFDAARVSLGSLGVITRVTLQNVASHKLKRRVWFEPLDGLIERFDEIAAAHSSFEMYYLPYSDMAMAITIDPTDDPVVPRGAETDNDSAMHMKKLRDVLSWWPGARRMLLNHAVAALPHEEAVDVWNRIYPSNRAVRFNEMEYHLPREQLMPTLRKVRQTLESRHHEEFFPIEVRTVKGDDAWLSPFNGHAVSGSIAVHRYYREDPLPYFADIEPLYQPLNGRPHWGKMNTLGARDFARLYPRWSDFLALRAQHDPDGRMLNPYLRRIFGLDA
jgi:FAD-linked oxidoreductase